MPGRKKPLVSVIMNCRNGEKFLYKSVKSVLKQTYKNLELIFWDNISTDNSKKIIKKFKDKRIRYFCSKKPIKLYQARNCAIKKAKGKYVTFIDVDDWWVNKKTSKQVELLEKNNSADLAYSKCWIFYQNNSTKKIIPKHALPEGKIFNHLLKNYYLGLLTVMVKRKIFKKHSFNNKYNIIGDFDLFMKISFSSKFLSDNSPLAYYRIHNENLTKKNWIEQINELNNWRIKNKKKLNLGKNIPIWVKKNIFTLRLKAIINLIFPGFLINRIINF
jgi:glycosyltransferase involved in cell wall biosynthesis